ncbi:polyhydroxyalkanoic acid system family protein [Qipengyuania sp. S6317L1]|uniref:polyhydroxyalkanoic acid system family protein n=1 Tax=Qipengyuania sp. S6317L1 TaxID=2926410 RepID=UPI001FF0F38C|nr:polyhydroxyalkanoic acid system family protein [Qipengyuania sp. S6317L1]MCK0097935.1 polyhydroxyalkanoic acid system family protein [Qipengyuania sp. S6317L1]
MRVSLPHSLGREEVRRRMHAHAHEIGSYFPPGMATVETEWPNEDRMDLFITAAGQQIEGGIDVGDDTVTIEMDLPAMLGFLRGTLERAVKKHGGRLLEKK